MGIILMVAVVEEVARLVEFTQHGSHSAKSQQEVTFSAAVLEACHQMDLMLLSALQQMR